MFETNQTTFFYVKEKVILQSDNYAFRASKTFTEKQVNSFYNITVTTPLTT